MAVVIAEGYAQVILEFKNAALARKAAVVYGVGGTGLEGNLQDLCDALTTAFATTIGGGVDDQVLMGPTALRVGAGVGNDPVLAEGTVTVAGAGTDTSSPAQVAVLFRKNSAVGGRANRGRMYVPWASGAVTVDEGGFLDPGVVSSYATAADAFLGELDDLDLAMVILHDAGSPTTTPTLVTGLVPQTQVATQRRRLGR